MAALLLTFNTGCAHASACVCRFENNARTFSGANLPTYTTSNPSGLPKVRRLRTSALLQPWQQRRQTRKQTTRGETNPCVLKTTGQHAVSPSTMGDEKVACNERKSPPNDNQVRRKPRASVHLKQAKKQRLAQRDASSDKQPIPCLPQSAGFRYPLIISINLSHHKKSTRVAYRCGLRVLRPWCGERHAVQSERLTWSYGRCRP